MTAEQTKPSSEPAISGFGLAVTILGGVCGAVLTEVLNTLEQSDPRKWIGLALGAALPPVIAALPQGKRQIQVGAAILLGIAAFVLAYFGQLALTSATDRPPNLATPGQIAEAAAKIIPTPTSTTADGGTTGRYAEGDLKMAWTPESVRCDDGGKCDEVVVTSEGAEPLRIADIEFRGGGAAYFQSTDCENAVLAQGDRCTITLGFDYESAPSSVSADLVIHQNFKGPATTVPIDAHGRGGPGPTCTVPDVVGTQRDDAEAAIGKAGLEVVEESKSSSRDAGTVLDVDPAPGEGVACGGTVTIVVSSGSDPEPCTVPDVVGMQRDDAEAAIGKAGLEVVEESKSSSRDAGTVLDVDPAPGEGVTCGGTVTIVVSSGEDAVG